MGEMFLLANSTHHHEILTKESIGQGKTFFDYAKNFKSPGKTLDDLVPFGNTRDSFTKLLLQMGHMKRKASEELLGEDFTGRSKRRIEQLVDDENIRSVFTELATRVDEPETILCAITEKLDEKDSKVGDELNVLMSRTESIESTLGNRIQSSSFQVPTVWASIATLAGVIEETKQSLHALLPESALRQDMEIALKRIEDQALESMRAVVNKIDHRIDNEKSNISDTMEERFKVSEMKFQKISGKANDTVRTLMSLAQGASILKDELKEVCKFGFAGNKGDMSCKQSCDGYLLRADFEYEKELVYSVIDGLGGKLSKVIADSEYHTKPLTEENNQPTMATVSARE
jgi:vacuolar-type H+-ATPase subunit E/Vma4